jgi:hypothetical protein
LGKGAVTGILSIILSGFIVVISRVIVLIISIRALLLELRFVKWGINLIGRVGVGGWAIVTWWRKSMRVV